jgi:hypothetical protein
LPTAIERIVFVITLADQPFAKLNNAEVKLVDTITDAEIARYELKQGKSSSTFIFGELVRSGNHWTFNELFQRSEETLATIAKEYGIGAFVEKGENESNTTPPKVLPQYTVENVRPCEGTVSAEEERVPKNPAPALLIDTLFTAVERGDIRAAKACIETGVDVNYRSPGKGTPIHCAVQSAVQKDMVEYLISIGANVNAKKNAMKYDVTPPSLTPASTDYFLQLRENTGGNRDFLRVPIAAVTVKDGLLTFHAIVSGTTGVGGHSLSNSIIYGCALVFAPTLENEIDDLTRDVVWSVGYFDANQQLVSNTSAQIAITFTLNLNSDA